MTSGSSAWRSLTAAQQTAWNDYAAQISRTDALGSSYSPTGAELYVGSTIVSGAVGFVTNPPATLPNFVLLVNGMTYTGPSPGPEAFSFDVNTTSTNNTILVETSGPVSPGVTSAAAVRRWRSLPGDALNLAPMQFPFTATAVSILANYNFLFPSPTTGQVVWFRFREIFYDAGGSAPLVNKSAQTFRFVA